MTTILIGRMLDGAALAVTPTESAAIIVRIATMATPMDLRMIGQSPQFPYGCSKRLKADICSDGIVTESRGFSACIWRILAYDLETLIGRKWNARRIPQNGKAHGWDVTTAP